MQPSGDIVWSHGYTSRKEASPASPAAAQIDGVYFSFQTGHSASEVVDRFELRRSGDSVVRSPLSTPRPPRLPAERPPSLTVARSRVSPPQTFYRNTRVGQTTPIDASSAHADGTYSIHGNTITINSDISGTVQSNGDILWSHGYTSRKEAPSPPPPPAQVGSLRKVEVGRVLSWFEARDQARQMGGRLPTTAELRAANVDVGYDQWTPITPSPGDRQTGRSDGRRGDGENAWANIGPRRYQIEYPTWGLDSSTQTWKHLTYFYVSMTVAAHSPPPSTGISCALPSERVCLEGYSGTLGVDDDCCGSGDEHVGCASGYTFSRQLAISEGGTWDRPDGAGFYPTCGASYGGNTCCTPVSSSPTPAHPVQVAQLDGLYYSFRTGGNPSDVVDRFEARQSGETVTFFRNTRVGQTSPIDTSSAHAFESYRIDGRTLRGSVTATVQFNGDIVWSHGYTSRKEALSPRLAKTLSKPTSGLTLEQLVLVLIGDPRPGTALNLALALALTSSGWYHPHPTPHPPPLTLTRCRAARRCGHHLCDPAPQAGCRSRTARQDHTDAHRRHHHHHQGRYMRRCMQLHRRLRHDADRGAAGRGACDADRGPCEAVVLSSRCVHRADRRLSIDARVKP